MKIKILSFLVFSTFINCSANQASTGTRGLIKCPNYFFVETGSSIGDGVQEAIDSRSFFEMYSMELTEARVEYVQGRFKANPNVTIIQGDTFLDLSSILQEITLPATFWLDARYSNIVSAKFYYDSGITASIEPLIGELDQIKAHGINSHTILINDINTIVEVFSSVFTLQDILDKLYEINSNYVIEYVDGGDLESLPGNVLKASVP